MTSRVSPAVPILFFGDVDAYASSPLCILTVGLNPSSEEFPARRPFKRFPLAADVKAADRQRYVRALSAYFRTDPYGVWFRNFEPLLNGARSSYYPGRDSTALHTDIYSPVATTPRGASSPKPIKRRSSHTVCGSGQYAARAAATAYRGDLGRRTSSGQHPVRRARQVENLAFIRPNQQRRTALTSVPGPVPVVRSGRRTVAVHLLPGRENAPHYQR